MSKQDNDTLGDRMKMYEGAEAMRRFMPGLPVLVRLDGRAFHSFTKTFRRPFDPDMMRWMQVTTTALVKETNARVGYTQSDEITLVMYVDPEADPSTEMSFGGRIQKTTSVLAAVATAEFTRLLPAPLAQRRPVFDARAWQVPTLDEAANCLLWRELDATKNSISMAASAYFSHTKLHGLDSSKKQELLFREKGLNWNDYSAAEKRGTYVLRRRKSTAFTAEEWAALPPKHNARTNPELYVERHVVEPVELPPLRSVINRVGVLFRGEAPYVRP